MIRDIINNLPKKELEKIEISHHNWARHWARRWVDTDQVCRRVYEAVIGDEEVNDLYRISFATRYLQQFREL